MSQARSKTWRSRGVRGSAQAAVTALALLVITTVMAGCGALFHPKAGEFLAQAQAGQADGVTTLLNLTAMMDDSLKAARGTDAYQPALDDLHNQFHALHGAFCGVTKEQASTPAYATASTIEREMRVVFHRLWKHREERVKREAHLDLFARRVQELRTALQAVKG